MAALRRRLRRHFERTGPEELPGVLRLGALSPEEREALASLMGRPPRFGLSMLVDIGAIDAALGRAGIAPSLRQALEQLEGPIGHRAKERAVAAERWLAVAADARHPHLSAFLQTPAGSGLLKRLSRQDADLAASLLDEADAVLCRLPSAGVPRAQLAAETLGDAHALDAGEAAATLVLAVLRQAGARNDDGDAMPDERARDVWSRVGVLVNELAKPALFLNLPLQDGERPLAPAGEPGYASLRALLRSPPAWAVAGRSIYVCENPNLVAIAADQLGQLCAPLVCTDGMPAAAQRTLLEQLVAAKARLLYHGDFDWPGIHIANQVMQFFGVRPWRFGIADYEAAVVSFPGRQKTLTGGPVSASWDTRLAPAMEAHGIAFPEEALTVSLLQDLADT